MIRLSKNLDICGDGRFVQAYHEHIEIFECIKNHDVNGAGNAMKRHLDDVLNFSLEKKSNDKKTQNNFISIFKSQVKIAILTYSSWYFRLWWAKLFWIKLITKKCKVWLDLIVIRFQIVWLILSTIYEDSFLRHTWLICPLTLTFSYPDQL
mgnify:CR=1 FL=1